jgi:hypothetical protein
MLHETTLVEMRYCMNKHVRGEFAPRPSAPNVFNRLGVFLTIALSSYRLPVEGLEGSVRQHMSPTEKTDAVWFTTKGHKSEEKELEEAKYARSTGSR